jgi:phosphate:Na+ symporter
VISNLKKEIRKNHNKRLANGKCSVELGMALTDMVTSLERIAKHCTNIAEEIIASETGAFDFHKMAHDFKEDNELYKQFMQEYNEKYVLPVK